MPIGTNLFMSKTIPAGNAFAPSRTLPVDDVDFISVGVEVLSATGTGAQMIAGIQWSFDGDSWTNPLDDPADQIATFTGPKLVIKRMPIKAPYYRLAAQVTGSGASFSVTGNALVWNK